MTGLVEDLFDVPRLMGIWHSCEDENTVEPQITRRRKITMATIWEGLVCGVHDVDYWKFAEGWNTFVTNTSPLLQGRVLTER
jgi:hypothetical protein